MCSFFDNLKKSREARRKKIEDWHKADQAKKAARNGTKTVVVQKPVVQKPASVKPIEQPVVEERSTAQDVTKAENAEQRSEEEQRTMEDKVNSMVDNIFNPENHPDPALAGVKANPSDEPTDEEDDDSQDDEDRAMDDLPTNTTGEPSMVPDVRSEESRLVETIPPPNSIKAMDKESMDKFTDDQRLQQNTGFLCGCI